MTGILVTSMGGIYRLSKRTYRRVLKDISNGKYVDLAEVGTMIGVAERDLTDMSAADAAWELKHLDRSENKH